MTSTRQRRLLYKPRNRHHAARQQHKRDWCTRAPDWLFSTGELGETCCRQHDKAYTVGGRECDRLWADVALLHCILAQGIHHGILRRGLVLIIGLLYFIGVRFGGRRHFCYR